MSGVWTTNKTEHTLTYAYSIHKQTQMTITDSTITMYTKATNYEAINAIVTTTNAREQSPSKQHKTKTVMRTAPSMRRTACEAEQDEVYFLEEAHNGSLRAQNESWRFKAAIFTQIISEKFGVRTRVTNHNTVSATLSTGRVGGKTRQATINYYPPSGIFTMTGPKELRDPLYEPFHQIVNDGPPMPSLPQVFMPPLRRRIE
jgi:hypothetical protein